MVLLNFNRFLVGLLASLQISSIGVFQSDMTKPSTLSAKSLSLGKSIQNTKSNYKKVQVIRSFDKEIAKGRVLITVDMESENGTARLLDALKKHGMKITFFVCGAWGHNHKSLIKRMADEGHEIANHTSGHKLMTKLSEPLMRQQITKLDQLIQSVTGQKPAPLFRPPYGAYNEKVLQVLSSLGYEAVVLWNVDPYDWKSNSTKNSVAHSLSKMQPGSIVVLHSYRHTIDAIIDQLPKIKAKGFTVASVGSVLSDQRKLKTPEKTTSVALRPK